MGIFAGLYDMTVRGSAGPRAERYLYALSVCESTFFPIPPDVMLAPMCAVQPHRALRFALWTTVFSVGGGVIGYLAGFFLFDWIRPWLAATGHWADYQQAVAWFERWGGWSVFVSAFSPIPYKLFTLSAGALSQNLSVFVFASLLGRGTRFMLVALLLRRIGPQALPHVKRWANEIGWATVAILALALAVSFFSGE